MAFKVVLDRLQFHQPEFENGGIVGFENQKGLFMPYEHTNSKGLKYFLNSGIGGRNGKTIYFFSKEPKNPIDLPQGFTIVENPLTRLPLLKKK